jgi:TolA-binding protein
MQEDALLKIKALWEKGEFVKAKKTYEEFTKDYPDVSSESMKEILGYTIYNGLFED